MATEHQKRVGARIRKRRNEQGLTQRQLADKIGGGTNSDQVSNWENGRHTPYPETFEKIAKALKVPMSYFHGDEPQAGTGDLMGSLASADQRRQKEDVARLERIEAMLDYLLTKDLSQAEGVALIQQIAERYRRRRGSGS